MYININKRCCCKGRLLSKAIRPVASECFGGFVENGNEADSVPGKGSCKVYLSNPDVFVLKSNKPEGERERERER